jgi:hypothetical protein
MILEVKDKKLESELCCQIIQRTTASMHMSYLLKNSISFGATPNNGYVCIGIREIPKERKEYCNLHVHLFSVKVEEIGRYWELLTRETILQPDCFLTEDAPQVLGFLRNAGIDAWLCRVHLLAWSMNRVYDVSLPRHIDFPSNNFESGNAKAKTKTVGVAISKSDFCLKVINDTPSFENEIKALHAVEPKFFIPDLSIYLNNKGILDFKEIQENRMAQSTVDSWWNSKALTLKSDSSGGGGTIALVLGQMPTDNDMRDKKKIFHDCMESLREMHASGYCHTDIRLPNIVCFDGKFCLVDFGEAVVTGTAIDLRGRNHPELLPQDAVGVSDFAWKDKHDVEQLAWAVILSQLD